MPHARDNIFMRIRGCTLCVFWEDMIVLAIGMIRGLIFIFEPHFDFLAMIDNCSSLSN